MSLNFSQQGARVHLPEFDDAPSAPTEQDVWGVRHEIQRAHPVLVGRVQGLKDKDMKNEDYMYKNIFIMIQYKYIL